MRMLARTASAALVCLCLAPASGQAQETTWWTNDEIDDWIESMENALSLADFAGDTVCAPAFSAAAGGLRTAKVGTTPGLSYEGDEVNGLWTPRRIPFWPFRNTIEINPASDDFARTVFHEALHEAGGYSHDEIYRLAGRPGVGGGECRSYLTEPQASRGWPLGKRAIRALTAVLVGGLHSPPRVRRHRPM